MKYWKKNKEDLLHRTLIFLILRFVVFLLIAMTIYTVHESEHLMTLWAAFGYFAVSEILLLSRSRRVIQDGITIGVYFLDLYAVSSLVLLQGFSELWYLTIPALMFGVSLCYSRKRAWLPIALIPSVLIVYQLYRTNALYPDKAGEILGVIFLLFVFSGIVHSIAVRTDRTLSLYQGQRRLIEGIPDFAVPCDTAECVRKIFQRESPLELDYRSVLHWDSEGNMIGLERIGMGEISEVRLGSLRIPEVFGSIKKRGAYFPSLLKAKEDREFFQVRRVESLLGTAVTVGEKQGVILFGRTGKDAFSPGDREILSTYADMLCGWIRQAYAQQEQERRNQTATKVSGASVEEVEEGLHSRISVEPERESDPAERLHILEDENRELKAALDEQLRAGTDEFKKTIVSLMARESELDHKVFERLASIELSRAISLLFDLNLVLDLILEVICEKLSVEAASIMLLRDKEGDLVVHASRGLSDEVVQKTRLMVGEAIAGYVAQKMEPLLIEDINKDPRFVPFRRERYRSGTLISVPILYEGNVLGVINLADPVREGPFTDKDLEVLQALSRQAAIAIVNHRLYQGFENGPWIRGLYEAGLTQKLAEKVFQEEQSLEKIDGEYRVSMLSIHLHESYPLDMEPEVTERIRLLEKYLQEVRDHIIGHQGDIAGESGAGMIGIFGLPFPDQNDPWRAVRTAVDLLKVFARHNQEGSMGNGHGVGISIGVASGSLLLREKKGPVPYAALGASWDRVVTLMQAGSPGQILVDEETFEKVSPRVHALRLVLPFGIQKKLTAYGIKGLKRQTAEG